MRAREFREGGARLDSPRQRKLETPKKGFAHWDFWARRWESSRLILVRRRGGVRRNRAGGPRLFLPKAGN